MPSCELSGVGAIHYETLGKGEPLLMLRGLGRSSRYWLGYEKQLAKFFKVILIDARAIGKSQAIMRWKDGIDDLARDCLAVLDKLRINRFHIFGLSLGGMIGLSLARLAPERVKSLTVANSSSADERGIRFHPYSFWLLCFALSQGRFHETLLRRTVGEAVARSRGPDILSAWRAIIAEEGFPIVPIAKQLLAASRFKIGGGIDGSVTPVLILVGGADLLVPRANSLKLQRAIPGSHYKVIKGAGHEITLGHETEITRILRDFTKVKSPAKSEA